jgi:hypothetical protein
LLSNLKDTPPHLTILAEGLESVAKASSTANKMAHDIVFWKRGLNSTGLITPTAHKVLSIPRLEPLHTSKPIPGFHILLLQESVRLALMIFLVPIKRAFGLNPDEVSPLLTRFSSLTTLLGGVSEFPELRLWANLVYVHIHKGSLIQAQLLEIRRAMRELGIHEFRHAVHEASNIAWIDHLYELETTRIEILFNEYFNTIDGKDQDCLAT